MKLITFEFDRDWQSARSVPGTGEVEHSPAGRAAETAAYVVGESYHEDLARAVLLDDFKNCNPTDVRLLSCVDVKGIVNIQRRFT